MKRFLFLSLCFLAAISASAQEVETNTTEIEGANSTDKQVVAKVIRETRSKDFNHWMISIGGGANLMLTERTGTQDDPAHNYRNNFQGAAYFNFGYMINPVWGVIAEYGFIPINKKIFTPEGDVTGYGHEATIQLDFNILNLVRKCRENTKWNVDAYIGAGFMAYNTKYKINQETGAKEHYYYPAICIPLSLKFQYCPIDELGIGLRLTGKWYSEDDINYVWDGTGNHNNDMALYAGLELQYNITTNGKHHVRVTDRCTYEPMNVVLEGKIVDVNKQAEQIEDLEKELQDLKDEVAVLNGSVDPDALKARQEARKMPEQPVQQQPVQQEVAKVAPQKPVDMSKYDRLFGDVDKMKEDIDYLRSQIMMSNGTDEYTVYFDFDKYDVKPEYQIVVAKVARALLKDKNLKVELVSSCDKAGSTEYNQPLGQNRAQAVYNILVNEYKIEKSRITVRYNGQVKDEFDSINRRCDIIFK